MRTSAHMNNIPMVIRQGRAVRLAERANDNTRDKQADWLIRFINEAGSTSENLTRAANYFDAGLITKSELLKIIRAHADLYYWAERGAKLDLRRACIYSSEDVGMSFWCTDPEGAA